MVSIVVDFAAQRWLKPARGLTYAMDVRRSSESMVLTSPAAEPSLRVIFVMELRDVISAATNGSSSSEAGIVPDSSPYIQIPAISCRLI